MKRRDMFRLVPFAVPALAGSLIQHLHNKSVRARKAAFRRTAGDDVYPQGA